MRNIHYNTKWDNQSLSPLQFLFYDVSIFSTLLCFWPGFCYFISFPLCSTFPLALKLLLHLPEQKVQEKEEGRGVCSASTAIFPKREEGVCLCPTCCICVDFDSEDTTHLRIKHPLTVDPITKWASSTTRAQEKSRYSRWPLHPCVLVITLTKILNSILCNSRNSVATVEWSCSVKTAFPKIFSIHSKEKNTEVM